MPGKPSPETALRWQQLIRELQQGTETVAEFAAARGVSTASIYHWKKRLGISNSLRRRSSRTKTPSGASSRQTPSQTTSFVPLSVVSPDRVEVELPSGVRIHVPPAHIEALRAAIGTGHALAKEEDPSC